MRWMQLWLFNNNPHNGNWLSRLNRAAWMNEWDIYWGGAHFLVNVCLFSIFIRGINKLLLSIISQISALFVYYELSKQPFKCLVIYVRRSQKLDEFSQIDNFVANFQVISCAAHEIFLIFSRCVLLLASSLQSSSFSFSSHSQLLLLPPPPSLKECPHIKCTLNSIMD